VAVRSARTSRARMAAQLACFVALLWACLAECPVHWARLDQQPFNMSCSWLLRLL
jgi:hypothetical protein